MPAQGIGGNLQVRLYIEGYLVENALLDVAISGNIGQPATCQLQLTPTNTIRHILPGTWIHVFVSDPWELNPTGTVEDFKLLFEGVVVNRGFTRMDDSRAFFVQCADPSVYWTSARQFWLNVASTNGDIMDSLGSSTSNGHGFFSTLTNIPASGYLNSELANIDDGEEETFLDTMIAVIDDIGNVNPFYTNARNRFRITDRILRARAGDSDKLFQMTLQSEHLNGLAGQISGQSNLAQVVNVLLGVVMHEWVPIVAPPYTSADVFERDAFGNIKREKQTVDREGKRGRRKVDLFRYNMARDNIVASVMFKPHIYTISPPTFNTLFPNMYDQASFEENFLAEPTRLTMKPNLPLLGKDISSAAAFLRPTELETFTALTRDSARGTAKQRTADGKYADGAGQVSTFTDFDWATNEERFRGIAYEFFNLAPAPSTLTFEDQGDPTSTGTRKGGVPKYLKNVASYEYYKTKLSARTARVSGPFNMRPVVGFPMVVLDDSDAKLNVVGYLSSIQHRINASGDGTTTYTLQYPRVVGEVDYNRPKFQTVFDTEGRLRLDLFRDEEGVYDFEKLFEGENAPPVPEWFDESFRNAVDLGVTYNEWFGQKSSVIQSIFEDWPRNKQLSEDGQEDVEAVLGQPVDPSSVGTAKEGLDEDQSTEFEETLATAENVTIRDAVEKLNELFLNDRTNGKEFERASTFTRRSFTKIDEAFRFIGASSLEFADTVAGDDGSGLRYRDRPATFDQSKSSDRVIDYNAVKLEVFVGDTSAGSHYTGTPLVGGSSDDLMTGAFPVFDTEIHTGPQATDAATRDALINDPDQRAPSSRPRYDGRPLMFDFEYRLWLQSRFDAGQTPTGEELAENAVAADYFVVEGDTVVRPKSPEDRASATSERLAQLRSRAQRESTRDLRGRASSDAATFTTTPPPEQAPTGDGLEQEQRLPLPQPLAEYQVVELRRAIARAYREELARNRGFTG